MSRLYYALFQAGQYAMHKLGKKPQEFGPSVTWAHGTICGNATIFRPGIRQDFHLFKTARALREQADYRDLPVRRDQVQAILPKVASFVDEVCR